MKKYIQFISESNSKFTKAENYLKEKQPQLLNLYRTISGEHSESCTMLAIYVAKLIMQDGGKPKILTIKGMKDNKDAPWSDTLYPKIYNGKISWGAHCVCENKGIIYDPMIGIPMEKKLYLETIFEKPAKANIAFTYKEIIELLQKRELINL